MIEAITQLGSALGYHVEHEWPIPGTAPDPEQVDIAIFIDAKAKAPIFAVEVESEDRPHATNNAIKIFGKPTSAMLKPFFVFHVFLRTTASGRRLENVSGMLLNHNYGVYDLSKPSDTVSFLTDLLSRHQAIRRDLDQYRLGVALDNTVWNQIDRYQIMEYAVSTLAPGCPSLSDLAHLSLDTDHLREVLLRACSKPRDLGDFEMHNMTFAGQMFAYPLLLGLQAYSTDIAVAQYAFKELRRWQDVEVIFSADLSWTGQSPEFDFAVHEIAPPMFCLVALLFYPKHPEAAAVVCRQLLTRASDGHLSSHWAKYAMLWAAVTAVMIKQGTLATECVTSIDELGGLPWSTLKWLPGPSEPESDEHEWVGLVKDGPLETPTPNDAVRSLIGTVTGLQIDLVPVVAKLFTDDHYLFTFHKNLLGK